MQRILLFLALAFPWSGPPAQAGEIRLSVAASMTDVTRSLISTYGEQAADVTFLPNFAASGSLAKQIAQGAPADLFVSANPKWMDYLVAQGRVPAATVRPFAGNTLVLVGGKARRVTTMADLAGFDRIALGSPRSVPAGQYAEQALRQAGLLPQLQGKLVMAQDVRQALVYAERGETDAAFVYRTDALLARETVILLEVPQALYDPIVYPLGLTVAGAARPEVVAFYEFLKDAAAAEILVKYGFVPPGRTAAE